MDLLKVPFSKAGSYMALIGYDGIHQENVGPVTKAGIYLKSTHGKSKNFPACFRIFPMIDGKEVESNVTCDYSQVIFSFEGGSLSCWFHDETTILITGHGKKLSVGIDCDPEPTSMFDFCIDISTNDHQRYMLNTYKSLTKFYLHVQEGQGSIMPSTARGVNSDRLNQIQIAVDSNDDLALRIEEVEYFAKSAEVKPIDFEESFKNRKETFERFKAPFGECKTPGKELAIYVMWSNIVRPQGYLNRYDIWMSNNHFPGVWGWDHAYNSLGLAQAWSDLSFDTMMGIFDHQNSQGEIPGSYSDSTMRWNFAKPPVHAFILEEALRNYELTDIQAIEVYEKLSKHIQFWFNYADLNGDGIPEYQHGNDSGYDNSTVFKNNPYMTSCDLCAYLVRAMEFLAKIAGRLGRKHDASSWQQQADEFSDLVIQQMIVDGRPISRDGQTGQVVTCRSQLPLTLLLMGNRLPQEVIDFIVSEYKSDRFLTKYGIATEQIDSADYLQDGYWQGPIWAPEMVNIYIALKGVGEKEFALDLARRFIKLVEQSGIHENFDPLSGEGLRDSAYTWCAGAYLYFDREVNGKR